MAKRKSILIDGMVREVKMGAKVSDVVDDEVESIVTDEGKLIPSSEFRKVPIPQGFETNLSAINKG